MAGERVVSGETCGESSKEKTKKRKKVKIMEEEGGIKGRRVRLEKGEDIVK